MRQILLGTVAAACVFGSVALAAPALIPAHGQPNIGIAKIDIASALRIPQVRFAEKKDDKKDKDDKNYDKKDDKDKYDKKDDKDKKGDKRADNKYDKDPKGDKDKDCKKGNNRDCCRDDEDGRFFHVVSKSKHCKGNNGFGNGGHDGSPNGFPDGNR